MYKLCCHCNTTSNSSCKYKLCHCVRTIEYQLILLMFINFIKNLHSAENSLKNLHSAENSCQQQDMKGIISRCTKNNLCEFTQHLALFDRKDCLIKHKIWTALLISLFCKASFKYMCICSHHSRIIMLCCPNWLSN